MSEAEIHPAFCRLSVQTSPSNFLGFGTCAANRTSCRLCDASEIDLAHEIFMTRIRGTSCGHTLTWKVALFRSLCLIAECCLYAVGTQHFYVGAHRTKTPAPSATGKYPAISKLFHFDLSNRINSCFSDTREQPMISSLTRKQSDSPFALGNNVISMKRTRGVFTATVRSKGRRTSKQRLTDNLFQTKKQWTATVAASARGCWKSAVAGAVAGAMGTVVLYPLDAAKTIRQASPDLHPSVTSALMHKLQARTLYKGVGTAVLGAMPSSALYFGAYESMRRFIQFCFIRPRYGVASPVYSGNNNSVDASSSSPLSTLSIPFHVRCAWYASAAATGNLVSSAIFVPKELIKQQLQFCSNKTVRSVVVEILQQQGIRGFYRGYRATVYRNIPSAALRFVLYEEFKRQALLWPTSKQREETGRRLSHRKNDPTPNIVRSSSLASFSDVPWSMFLAGAAAGAIASGIMTPIDLIKTKIATGTCPVDLPSCVQSVVTQHGVPALWTGAGSRMISSAAFSAIGFGTYETVQRWLN